MIDYLAKTLGKSNESIKELLYKKTDDGALTEEINPDALESLESLHAEHINAAPADVLKAEYDKGHKQGSFEALSKAEDSLRKTYGIEEKGKLSELIAVAVAKTAKAETSDDKVLTHPLYLKLKTESTEAIEAANAAADAKVAEVTARAERQSRFVTNQSKIEAAMAEAGVVLPKNAAAAATLKREFLKQFEAYDFDETETGVYLKGQDGKLVKDKHGHPVTVEAYTKTQAANWFDIEKQPARQTPGNEGDSNHDNNKPATWDGKQVPKNQTEFNLAYEQTPPEQRPALFSAYAAAQGGK